MGRNDSDSQNDSDNTKSRSQIVRMTKSMIAFQDYFNDTPQSNNTCVRDLLHQSEDSIFPFPQEAAKTLAELRSDRFDKCDLAIEEAEMRIREFASMMGLSTLHDDPPSAA